MAEVKPIPEGHGGLIAHIVVDGAKAAMEFYTKAFGAEEICSMPMPGGDKIMHAEMKIGDAVLYLCDDFPEMCGGKPRNPKALGTTSFNLHQYVVDTDAAIEKAVNAGATVEMPAMDMFWGDRFGMVVDPFGHRWAFGTHIADPTPEQMQAACEAMMSGEGCCGGNE